MFDGPLPRCPAASGWTAGGTVTAGPGEIVYMPKGESVTIRSHEQGGAVTACVTHPHWQKASSG